MDLDSIKVIADTATQLTGEAKQVFIWWLLGKEVLSMLLTAGVILGVAFMGYRLIRASMGLSEAEAYIKLKRDQFGTGSPGGLLPTELGRTIREIEKRLEEANK